MVLVIQTTVLILLVVVCFTIQDIRRCVLNYAYINHSASYALKKRLQATVNLVDGVLVYACMYTMACLASEQICPVRQ